jgi:hypothetical protein
LFLLKGFADVIKGELHIIEFLALLTIIDVLLRGFLRFIFSCKVEAIYSLLAVVCLKSFEKNECFKA